MGTPAARRRHSPQAPPFPIRAPSARPAGAPSRCLRPVWRSLDPARTDLSYHLHAGVCWRVLNADWYRCRRVHRLPRRSPSQLQPPARWIV